MTQSIALEITPAVNIVCRALDCKFNVKGKCNLKVIVIEHSGGCVSMDVTWDGGRQGRGKQAKEYEDKKE